MFHKILSNVHLIKMVNVSAKFKIVAEANQLPSLILLTCTSSFVHHNMFLVHFVSKMVALLKFSIIVLNYFFLSSFFKIISLNVRSCLHNWGNASCVHTPAPGAYCKSQCVSQSPVYYFKLEVDSIHRLMSDELVYKLL